MIQRGRKTADAFAVVTPITSLQRLQAPATLTDEQRAVWLETVNNRPADWFGREQAPLLECYCGHMAYARMLRRVLDTVDPAWLLHDEALQRHNKLFAMHVRETTAAANFATKLRLTSQSLTDKRVAGRAGERYTTARKPWQTNDDES
jgi:gluconate kinase